MTSSESFSRQIGILDFWHKIEFFVPFNLKIELENKSKPEYIRTFNKQELWAIESKTKLWQVNIPDDQEISGFNLYLAMFDHKDLTIEIQKELNKLGLTYKDEFITERMPSNIIKEGNTCFAKLKLNEFGSLIPTSVEVSTSPWAIGKIRQDGFNSLDFSIFETDLRGLKQELSQYYDDYIAAHKSESNDYFAQIPLSGKAICHLIKILLDWAGYDPVYDNITKVATIQVITRKKREKKTKEEKISDNLHREEQDKTELEISILNSFFAKDILKAIQSFNAGNSNPVLAKYLMHLAEEERIDLFSEKGMAFIEEILLPQNINLGHWFSEPSNNMSLMQQFVINTFFKEIDKQYLFSVNGPPGTGKTTLLRDIFAENLIQRAKILAKYEDPKKTLGNKLKVNFFDGKTYHIPTSSPELTGFEMVVASSNNAAVENISKELPQIDSLGSTWLHHGVSYLQPVIQNMMAQREKSYHLKLGNKKPWGLFSVALGNSKNRQDFVSKFFFEGKDKTNYNKNLHQSIWSWRNANEQDTIENYQQIRIAFIQQTKKLDAIISDLMEINQHNRFFKENTLEHYLDQDKEIVNSLSQELETVYLSIHQSKQAQKENEERLNIVREKLDYLYKNRPAFYIKLFNKQKQKEYESLLEKFNLEITQLLDRKAELLELITQQNKTIEYLIQKQNQAQTKLVQLEQEWENKYRHYQKLRNKYPDIELVEHFTELDSDKWQVNGIWSSKKLNQQRSELFELALKLHEAWLAEVLQYGFASNLGAIQQFLSGNKPINREHILSIWQSLFMVIPVVSTTFAAFSSQFGDLDAQSLGWLFIDEAGQASPQMAVGALWRAKRAMVVGDPLQIEPVVMIDNNLIAALKQTSQLPEERDYSPNQYSVQNLADWGNPFGIQIGEQWLGSPLRVHRRCVDPMFSIANKIAYENKMIYFAPFDPEKRHPPKESLDLGISGWVHLEGKAIHKHIVMAQVELVQAALADFYVKHQHMPPIYIISPFKKMANKLTSYLQDLRNWQNLLLQLESPLQAKFQQELKSFCNHAIGTVHTFQGKEQSIVLMVLGCDLENERSAKWAASAPNLLNVALTRAKHRFFMIGDINLWGKLAYFDVAKKHLPLISPKAFLEQVNKSAYSS